MSDGYGDFSPSADPEDPIFKCTPGHIPILPVRFSLLPYDLGSIQKPSSLTSKGSYILRELRRGFVYIFIEAVEATDTSTSRDGQWFVFRRGTSNEDVNADFVPDETDYEERGSFRYHKYEWSDAYGRGPWRFEGESVRYPWVPRWASKIWVAYSEFRWPPSFFRDGAQESFRKRMMTPVDLRGQNTWAAFIGEAADMVEEWKPADSRDRTLQSRLNLSQTAFRTIPADDWRTSIIEDENDKCTAVVAVMDPLGDVAEMNYRLAQKDSHQRSFSASHIFPLSIGHICNQMSASLPERNSWHSEGGILPDFMSTNGPALKSGWRMNYMGLKSIVDQAEYITAELIAAIQAQVVDEGDQMLGTHLKLASDLVQGEEDIDALEYYSVLLGRALGGMGVTPLGSQALSHGLGANVPSPGPSLRSQLSMFRRLWGATGRKAFDAYQKQQYSFQIVMEAIAVELGAELGSGRAQVSTWQEALDAGFRKTAGEPLLFTTRTVSLDDAIDFMTNTHTTTPAAGSAATDIFLGIDDAGGGFARQIVSTGANADIPTVGVGTTVKMVGGFDAAGRIELNGLTYASAGLLLSTWGLIATATGQQSAAGLFARGTITSIGESKAFQLTTAAVGVAEGLRTTFQAAARVGPSQTTRITAEVVETIYQGAGTLRGLTVVSAQTGAAASGLGQRLNWLLPKLAIVVGVVVSSVQIVRGVERDDQSQVLGNALMLVGGLMLIPGLNVGVAIAGAIIMAVGFLVTMTTYSQVEDVVRVGFWGSSTSYHSLADRPDFTRLIAASKDLPGAWKDFYDVELSRFMELGWQPVIEDPVNGDLSFVVRCEGLRTGNVGLVRVSAKEQTQRGRRTIKVLSKTPIPGQPAMVVMIERPRNNTAYITARVRAPQTGLDFEAEATLGNV